MDVFEYARMVLFFGAEPEVPKHIEGTLESFVPVMLTITTFEENQVSADGNVEIIEIEKSPLVYRGIWNGTTYSGRPQRIEGDYMWGVNYPIIVMTPYFAKLGKMGWEVIEFKFGSDRNSFANALLKRKIQKK